MINFFLTYQPRGKPPSYCAKCITNAVHYGVWLIFTARPKQNIVVDKIHTQLSIFNHLKNHVEYNCPHQTNVEKEGYNSHREMQISISVNHYHFVVCANISSPNNINSSLRLFSCHLSGIQSRPFLAPTSSPTI